MKHLEFTDEELEQLVNPPPNRSASICYILADAAKRALAPADPKRLGRSCTDCVYANMPRTDVHCIDCYECCGHPNFIRIDAAPADLDLSDITTTQCANVLRPGVDAPRYVQECFSELVKRANVGASPDPTFVKLVNVVLAVAASTCEQCPVRPKCSDFTEITPSRCAKRLLAHYGLDLETLKEQAGITEKAGEK